MSFQSEQPIERKESSQNVENICEKMGPTQKVNPKKIEF